MLDDVLWSLPCAGFAVLTVLVLWRDMRTRTREGEVGCAARLVLAPWGMLIAAAIVGVGLLAYREGVAWLLEATFACPLDHPWRALASSLLDP